MKKIFFFTAFIFILAALQAQTIFERPRHDNIWVLNESRIDFSHSPPLVIASQWEHYINRTNANICTAEGDLLAFSNGRYIVNAQNETVENGDRIDTGPLANGSSTFVWPQMMIALPKPGGEDTIFFFHQSPYRLEEPNEYSNIYFTKLYYSAVVFNEDYPDGYVYLKGQLLSDSLMELNKLTAVRHANGRDWWVIMPQYRSIEYQRFLLSPQGVTTYPPALVSHTIADGLGQACFSPDGTRYARLDIHQLGGDKYLNIMDFDRCSATFSNQQQIIYVETAIVGGLAFSENNRFLYVASTRFLYQFDLEAADIAASQTIIGTVDEIDHVGYDQCQLAPNGKIFVGPTGNSLIAAHIIHQPNKLAPACDFEYLGFLLTEPLSRRNVPNYPYYGLGPMDGSPCDSLNINNPVPSAAFEYWQPDSTQASVLFFDASFFATAWSWDFGDQTAGSSLRHPEHDYVYAGMYEVCLTATNQTGSHTYCEWLDVKGQEKILSQQLDMQLAPNPVQDRLLLLLNEAVAYDFRLLFYDASGRMLREWVIASGTESQELEVADLPAAVYFYRAEKIGTEAGSLLATGRVVKM